MGGSAPFDACNIIPNAMRFANNDTSQTNKVSLFYKLRLYFSFTYFNIVIHINVLCSIGWCSQAEVAHAGAANENVGGEDMVI